MYRFELPGNIPDIEFLIDELIAKPLVVIDDKRLSIRLGIYTKSLRKRGILGIYWDDKLKETIARLKVKNVEKHKGIGRKIEYLLDETEFEMSAVSMPRVKLPRI